MKIKFKKFEPTGAFVKLFGRNRDTSASETSDATETGDVYEYYYKRGDTYYFRNSEGNKVTIDYKEPQSELVRGHRYTINDLNNRNS